MDLRKIFTISGKSGLFKMISAQKTMMIVESLIDKKRMPAFARERMSSLAEISMFTEDADVSLKEVLVAIYKKENGGKAIDPKSDNEALKSYFAEVLPNYDRERVHVSDIKKLVSWYNLLLENNLVDDKEEEETEETATEK